MTVKETISQLGKRLKVFFNFKEKEDLKESKSKLKKYILSFELEKTDRSQLSMIKNKIINNPWVSTNQLLTNWINPNKVEITFYSMNDKASVKANVCLDDIINNNTGTGDNLEP